nr:PREDICTED: uncharacterized protein LOC109029947 [Bemisia tabaci]
MQNQYLELLVLVLQGSIFGPLFLLLCVNDMYGLLEKQKLTQYADDMSIILSALNLQNLEVGYHIVMKEIEQYFSNLELILNLDKTEVMLFQYPRLEKFQPAFVKEEAKEVNILEMLDNELRWDL